MKKLMGVAFLLLMISGVYAQDVNDYKYVIIPKKFEVLKDTNEYQLNVLAKLFFKEAGFTAIYDDDLPDDLWSNNCLALHADLEEDSGMFNTRLKITLYDCQNNLIFTSAEGRSRKKEFKQAHQEALKDAFKSIKALNYNYKPPATEPPPVTPEAETESTPEPATEQPVENTAAPLTPPPAPGVEVLYAQPVTNGFQLVDSTPKVVYTIQSTSLRDMYIIKDKNGILYKSGTNWIAEYYREDTWVQEIVTIKF